MINSNRNSARSRANVGVSAVVALTAAALAACSSSSSSSSTKATAGAASGAGGTSKSGLSVGMVELFKDPQAAQAASGAAYAAHQYGASFSWQAPAGLDPGTAISEFQQYAAQGTKVVTADVYPAAEWKTPLNQAIAHGMTVVTSGLPATGSNVTGHVAAPQQAMGKALADAFIAKLSPSAHGAIDYAICTKGAPTLDAPAQGFHDEIKAKLPAVTIADSPALISTEPTQNYTDWQRLVARDSGALGFAGFCDQDGPNLTKIMKASSKKYLAGAVSPDTVADIRAVQDGTLVATVGRNTFVQGYLPVKLALAHLADGKPLPTGYVDSGFELIDQSSAAAALKVRQVNTSDAYYQYYQPSITKALSTAYGQLPPIDTEFAPTS